MTDDEALVYAAMTDPEDHTPRLVFADWLDENGHHDRAEVIRARCALDTFPVHHPNRTALAMRERLLSARHAAEWVEQCGLPLSWEQALALFRRRLAETTAWCGRGKGALRTAALAPGHFVWDDGPGAGNRTLTTAERQALVNRLTNRRAEVLTDRGREPGSPHDGRLLLFHPNVTLCDGAAEVESEGFFDAENVPAWDTWVWVADDPDAAGLVPYVSYLVCWVPPDWLGRANRGITVNPEECIRWAASAKTPLTRRLRKAGLLT